VQSRVDALHAQLDRETAQVPNLVSGKYSPAAANPNAARVRDEMDFFNSISNPLYYFELLKMIDREVANLWVHRNIPQTASGLDNYITDSFKNWAKDFVNIHKYFSSMTPGRKLDAIHYFLLMSQMHRSMLRTVFDCSDRGESWEIMECGGSDVFYCEALAGGVCSYVVLGHPSALCRYNTGLVLRQTPVDVSHYNVRVDSRFANGDIAASLYRLHSSFPFNDLRSFCRVTAVTEILRAITNAVPQSKSDQSPTKIAQLPQNCNSLGCTLSYKFLCDERIDILANRVCYTDPATQKTILAAASYGENIVYLSANEKVEPAMYLRNCPILGLQSVIVNNVATDPVWMHLSSILCHSLFGPVGYLVSGGNHIRRVYPTGHVEALAQHSLSVLPHQNFITKFIG
jgi:hypothetical protein